MSRGKPLKICPKCRKTWMLRDDLLSDPNVSFLGYQMHFEDFEKGLFFFNHLTENCQTTFALRVEEFIDLYEGPLYDELKLGDEECPLYCLRRLEKRLCGNACAAAFVRNIMHTIEKIHQQAVFKQQKSAVSL